MGNTDHTPKDPFNHPTTYGNPNLMFQDGMFTIATIAADGRGAILDQDGEYEYDTIQFVSSTRVRTYAEQLVSNDEEVLIYQGECTNLKNRKPVAYCLPGPIGIPGAAWFAVTSN